VNALGAYAERDQLGDLILHQRDERTDDQGHSAPSQARELVAERLPRARRHDEKNVAPEGRRFANGFLVGPERRKAEPAF
jgi:hypothetical protein